MPDLRREQVWVFGTSFITSDQFHEPHDQFLMTTDQHLVTSDQHLVTSDQFQ